MENKTLALALSNSNDIIDVNFLALQDIYGAIKNASSIEEIRQAMNIIETGRNVSLKYIAADYIARRDK